MGIARLGAYHIGVGVFVRCFGAQAAWLLFLCYVEPEWVSLSENKQPVASAKGAAQ